MIKRKFAKDPLGKVRLSYNGSATAKTKVKIQLAVLNRRYAPLVLISWVNIVKSSLIRINKREESWGLSDIPDYWNKNGTEWQMNLENI
jgi:hypothetical protein